MHPVYTANYEISIEHRKNVLSQKNIWSLWQFGTIGEQRHDQKEFVWTLHKSRDDWESKIKWPNNINDKNNNIWRQQKQAKQSFVLTIIWVATSVRSKCDLRLKPRGWYLIVHNSAEIDPVGNISWWFQRICESHLAYFSLSVKNAFLLLCLNAVWLHF